VAKLKVGIISALALAGGMAVLLLLSNMAQLKLREENQSLRQQADQLAELAAENGRLSNVVANATGAQASAQLNELLRLRSEVGRLRKQTNELGKLQDENGRLQASLAKARQERPPAQEQLSPAAEQEKQEAIAKMNYTRGWIMAFHLYAAEHQGQAPASFDQAAAFLPEEAKAETKLGINQFELVYQGSLNGLANPSKVIVIRETQARQSSDGSWSRAYAFADGHSEIHRSVDGNFEKWESELLPKPAAQ
jgi:hypothetical protein